MDHQTPASSSGTTSWYTGQKFLEKIEKGKREVTMQPSQTGSANSAERSQLAEAVREACVQAALARYQEARMDGLCHEGAWECALDAVRSLDLSTFVETERSVVEPSPR